MSGIISNNITLKTKIECSDFFHFLSVFLNKQDENVVLLGSIVTCLALSVMTLLGTLNLMFTVGLMIPLLVGSGVFKIVAFFKQRYEQKRLTEQRKQMGNIFDNNIIMQRLQTQNLNPNKDKDNPENNHIPP